MSKIYRTREGDVAAVDTKTQLATLGSQAAPGPLLVPNNAKRICGLIVAGINDLAAAEDSANMVRIEGPGLEDGPESLAVGAEGVQVATGGCAARLAEYIPIELDVNPNQEIQLFGEMLGEDMGQVTLGVTVVFEV